MVTKSIMLALLFDVCLGLRCSAVQFSARMRGVTVTIVGPINDHDFLELSLSAMATHVLQEGLQQECEWHQQGHHGSHLIRHSQTMTRQGIRIESVLHV